MKIKIVIVILAVAAIALGIALFATKQQAETQHHADLTAITEFSNQLVSANSHLIELGQVNLQLTNDLTLVRQQSVQLSNSLTTANTTLAASLASANTALEQTKNSLVTAENQITNLNVHLADLEVQNKALDQKASELTNAIAQLNTIIEETQKRLAASESDRKFVEQELKKEMAQKAELERKFNDLQVLRAQVKKIKEEIFVARRLQWIKADSASPRKGAELLIQRTARPQSVPEAKTLKSGNYDLNVEVGSDGSVKVIPPLGAATNAPAH